MIRNPDKFMAGFWDWDILRGCFGFTKIKPTDIDGCVERNGQTLIIETKGPDVPIPQGQFIMFETWAKTGYFTILVVWGETDNPTHMMLFRPGGQVEVRKEAGLGEMRDFITRWFEWANTQQRIQ
jgi:hypothetical protein